jgi:hypothetical protein
MRRMLKDSSYRRDWFNTDIVVIDVAFQLAVDIGNDPSLWHTPEQLLSYKAFGKNMKWDASNDGSIVWRDGVWVETSLSDEERITLWHQQFDGALQRSQKEFYALSLSRVQPSYIHEAFARALERLQQRAEYLRGIQY